MSYVRVQPCRHTNPTATAIDLIVGDGHEERAICLSSAAARLFLLVLNRAIADLQVGEDLRRTLH